MRSKLIVLFQLLILTVHSQNGSNNSSGNRISEERYVLINGIEQWITIKGDRTKPIVLFIHGGPGSALSPYADSMYGKWEQDYILVQWDQRGTAKTYGRNAPEELTPAWLQSNPLTIEQMTADGLELARYLISYIGKQKIIIFGTSWGSVLAVKMVLNKPEYFYAYIGHSQVVNPTESSLYAYEQLDRLALKANDQQSSDFLRAIGKPPYDTARNTGRLIQLTKKYQQKNSTPAPASWKISPGYSSKTDDQNRSDGDDYSFVNYAGDKRLGIVPMSSSINLFEESLLFKIPVYFIQGKEDIQTPVTINKKYFSKITAPVKKFILLPKTDHGFNQSVLDTQFEILRKYIVPLLK